VVPVVLAADLLEVLLEGSTHGDDAVGHSLDLSKPLLVELGGVQNLRGDASSVNGRVRVHGTDQDLDLGVDTLLLLWRLSKDRERTNTLAVKTLYALSATGIAGLKRTTTNHVLGERLAEHNLVALLDEVTESVGILVGITGGESLVGHVEQREVTASLDGVADRPPLLGSGVNTSGVVRAGVQEEDGAAGSVLDVPQQSIDVETDGLLVVVAVALNLQATVVEDVLVIGPRWSWQVDSLVVGVVTLQESAGNAQSTGSGDGLSDSHIVQDRAVGTVGKDRSSLGESRNTSDTGVLLVQVLLGDALLGGANGRQNVRLALVVTVGTNTCKAAGQLISHQRSSAQLRTKVDLLVKLVRLVCFGDSCGDVSEKLQ
jgi:hypothetical protein